MNEVYEEAYKMVYCPRCGKEIVIIKQKENAE